MTRWRITAELPEGPIGPVGDEVIDFTMPDQSLEFLLETVHHELEQRVPYGRRGTLRYQKLTLERIDA